MTKKQHRSRTSRLNVALDYRDKLGFSVIPAGEDKTPCIAWKSLQGRKPSDAELSNWFKRNPAANIAAVTGRNSDLVVVDADNKKATEVIRALLPKFFKGPIAASPRGGSHFYFKHDERIKSKNGIFPYCDIKAEGGYVLMPPSHGRGGVSYKWEVKPSSNGIPAMPEDLRDLLLALQAIRSNRLESRSDFLTQGRRDDDLFHIAYSLARFGLAIERTRSITLNLARICTPPFDKTDALQKVASAYERVRSAGDVDAKPSLIIKKLSEVSPQPVHWLWLDVLPKGKLTLLVGDPDLGKSLLSIDIAARVTSGRRLPLAQGPPIKGSVILLTAEDGLADTVRIRADAAGANPRKIFVLEGILTSKGEEQSFSLDQHLAMLEQQIGENPDVVLVIIDPLPAYLGWAKEENASLRSKIFSPLAKLAERTGVAILAISHFKKDELARTLYRVLGSLAYVAAARAVWAVAKDKRTDNPSSRILYPVKANLSKNPPAFAFSIGDNPAGGPRIIYDPNPLSLKQVEQLLSSGGSSRALREAVGWLREFLREGKVESNLVREAAEQNNISEATLRRARKQLGIRVEKGSSQEGGKWFLSLPNEREET